MIKLLLLPPRCTNITVVVVLLDENDNSPIFRKPAINEISLREDSDIGATIAQVEAVDMDSMFPIAFVEVNYIIDV